jgi:hypothetical protein
MKRDYAPCVSLPEAKDLRPGFSRVDGRQTNPDGKAVLDITAKNTRRKEG